MDSFELNKIAGAVLGTLTLTLGLGIFSEILFAPEAPAKPGYEIASPKARPRRRLPPPPRAFRSRSCLPRPPSRRAPMSPSGAARATTSRKAPAPRSAPDLYGIVDRPVASAPGFAYSAAMKAHGGNWTPQALNTFLANPKADISRHGHGLRRHPQGDGAGGPDRLSEFAVPQPEAAAHRRRCGARCRSGRRWRQAGRARCPCCRSHGRCGTVHRAQVRRRVDRDIRAG